MKKIFITSMLALILLLAGCAGDPVQDDLIRYINDELPPALELEAQAIDSYESVTGVNYIDDLSLYEALNEEVIPSYNEFIKELEGVNVETDELKEIHEEYIDAANLQYNAFVKMLTALENQDHLLIEEVNSMLEQSRKQIRNYQNDVEKLADEHNVEINDLE